MIEIEKGIPIPQIKRVAKGGRPSLIGKDAVDALHKMEINDSFKLNKLINKNTLYVFLSREGKRCNRKFKLMPEPDGYRIWRTE
jgi:hypothetical protein